MFKPRRLVLPAVLTLAVTVPALGWAQAVPRGSGSSGGGSGSSGGGSSSSGGGSSSSSGSGSSGSSESPTYSPPPPPRTPPPQRTAPSGGPRTGSAVPRGSSGSGSTSSTGPGSSSVSGNSSGATNTNQGAVPRSRDRNGRPMSGVAVPRDASNNYLPSYINANRGWYPWYDSSLNGFWGYNGYRYAYRPIYLSPFVSYNPLFYSNWMYGGRYGLWYDPFDPFSYYDPFYLDPYYGAMGGYGGYTGYGYGGGYSSGYSGGYSSSSESASDATGSVRLRVKPANGKVYLDGTLVGVVDEFDGLTSHLAATAGRHDIEVRADGYEPLKLTVNVEEDKTVTARGSMKKK